MSDTENKAKLTPQQLLYAGGTLVAGVGIDLIAHLGPTGAVVGVLAAFVAARHGDDIKEMLPFGTHRGEVESVFENFLPRTQRVTGQPRTLKQRLLGQFPVQEDVQEFTAKPYQPLPVKQEPREDDFTLFNFDGEDDLAPPPFQAEPLFPSLPADETLFLGEVAATGERFDPPIDSLFGNGMLIAGVQGSGKSNVDAVVIEQAAKCGVPCIIFDYKGEYASLADLPHMNVLRAGAQGLDCDLTEQNAYAFVQTVMGERYQGIIDLPSYGEDWKERASIIGAVGAALMLYASRQRPQDRIPCLVLLDEAHWFLPQNRELLPADVQKEKEILNALSSVYFKLVSTGRSYGVTVIFSTQSLTYIAKWAIKSCQCRLYMRHVERNDLNMCEEEIDKSIATRSDMMKMAQGNGVMFGFTDEPMIVHFDRRQSRHDSHTPNIKRLRKPIQEQRGVPLNFRQPTVLRAMPPVPVVEPMRQAPALPEELQRAYDGYQQGYKAYRSLGEFLGVNKDKAGELIRELQRRGLVA